VINKKSEISFEDVAKLRRDSIIFEGVTKSILVYSKIGFEMGEFELSVDGFRFEVDEWGL
jgi:hypothetical protein